MRHSRCDSSTWITSFSVRRANVVLLITFGVILFGIYSVTRVKTELIPSIDFPAVSVITRYPDVGSTEVVDQVTIPIEQRLGTLGGLENLRSFTGEGVSVVVAEFAFGEDMDKREAEAIGEMQSLLLPEGAGRPQVVRASFNQVPIVQFSVSSDTMAAEDLERLIRGGLVPELATVNDVASVELFGGQERQVTVALDPDLLAEAGITAATVADYIANTNVSQPSGVVATEGTVVPVRTEFTIDSVEVLASIRIPTPDGADIALADLGTVEIGNAPTAGLVLTNGQRALGINVIKSENGNTVRVANEIVRIAERFERGHPGVSVEPIVDQSDFIEQSIGGLLREGGIGGFFAVLIVLVFLRSVRATLITAISIPLSILIALIVMNMQGLTVNVFTLGGLTIAVGRVIDDSIVVLENIVRHVHMGERPLTAIKNGTREVANAITSSTLTTVAVFLPIGLVGGIVGQLFFAFAVAVSVALLASLLVAVTIIPVLARYFVPREPREVAHDEASGFLQRMYTPVLEWALAHRWVTLGVAGALFAASMAAVPFLPTTFLPAGGEAQFQVSVTPPPGADPETVEQIVLEAGAIVEGLDGFEVYQANIGGVGGTFETLGAAFSGRGAGGARMVVRMKDGTDVDKVTKELRVLLQPLQDRTQSLVTVDSGGGAGPPGLNRVQIVLKGADPVAIGEASDARHFDAGGFGDLANLTSDVRRAGAEVAVHVDPARANAAGLSVAGVAREVQLLTSGRDIARINADGAPLVVHMQIGDGSRLEVDAIAGLRVGPPGSDVVLSDVATIDEQQAPVQVSRFDQTRAATVSADITADDTGGISGDVKTAVDALDLPEGVEIEYTGFFSQFSEGTTGLFLAIAVSMLLVYIIMVAFFSSLLDPFVILFSVPLALVGAVAALFITQRALGVPALVGVLMLVGVVVTNAIVFLDFVRQLREKGVPVHESLVRAGQTRVRPILMTALATMLGLFPLALGASEGAIVAGELATVVIGGMLTSTVLTLLVIPVVYSIKESLVVRFRGDETAST